MFMLYVHVHVSSSNHLMCVGWLERLYNLKCWWSLVPGGRYHNGDILVSVRISKVSYLIMLLHQYDESYMATLG